ncbi:hypothetical protein K501DRAFT_183669, partial [Backusella circina FSU 941]
RELYVSIELLNSFVRRHCSASFSSLCSVLSFSLQYVCTTITLSTTEVDYSNIGGYIQIEVRHANIPNNYNNHVSWIVAFELVAYLVTSLREQETILETIKKENSGIALVEDIDRALHVLDETNDQPLP